MFFPCRKMKYHIQFLRKEKCILPARNSHEPCGERRAPTEVVREGSMTLEAALVLPWFLFAMLSVLQFGTIMLASSALLAGMQDTAKNMAAYAYIRELGVSAGEGVAAELLTGGLSTVYAKGQVMKKAGFTSEMGDLSFLQSDFTGKQIIDLAASYRPPHTYTLLPVPRVRSLLRARVRAWTGREGSGGGDEDSGKEKKEEETVLVTTTGKVYHRDENCTHIKLSIREVSTASLKTRRNNSGGKYHSCEKCGGSSGSRAYISPYGDKHHSTLSCSGLKRNVITVPVSKVKGWKACSKCGGG